MADARIKLTWSHDGQDPQRFLIYRDDSPMDPEDLPSAIGSVAGGEREYIDSDAIAEDREYFFLAAADYGSSGMRIGDQISVPTSGGDPNWSYVRALLRFEGPSGTLGITDEVSGRSWSRTSYSGSPAGTAEVSAAQSRFGVSSLRRQNRDLYYTTSKDVIGSSSTAHTLEAWVWVSDGATGRNIIFSQEKGGASSEQYLSVGGHAVGSDFVPQILQHSAFSGSEYTLASSLGAIATETWTHIALDFDGAALRLFVNGVLGAKATRSSGWIPTTNAFKLSESLIASYEVNRIGFNGYIDEVRITYGVSRYGSDDGFSPPAAQFPAWG